MHSHAHKAKVAAGQIPRLATRRTRVAINNRNSIVQKIGSGKRYPRRIYIIGGENWKTIQTKERRFLQLHFAYIELS